MADGIAGDVLKEGAFDSAPPAPASGTSLPIPNDPGVPSEIVNLTKSIYNPFYNKFRLMGYLVEANYSSVLRWVTNRLKNTKWAEKNADFQPSLFMPDWKSAPRMVLNVGEAVLFSIPAVFDHIRERREMHRNISEAVAAELGRSQAEVNARDIRNSKNPLVQTNGNRYRSLLMLRYAQPLSFLFGLRLGITATVIEIIAERSAFFEKNAYEQLQRVIKEVGNNEWGSWSHDTLVSHLVQIVQQNRVEHKAAPITSQEMEQYMPLLGKVARHVMNKEWHLPEALYVLGELVKEPGLPHKVWQALEEVETLGLSEIAKRRRSPGQSAPGAGPAMLAAQTTAADPGFVRPHFVQEIVDRGPRTSGFEAARAEQGPPNLAVAQR